MTEQRTRTTREAIVHVLKRAAKKEQPEMTTKEVVKAVIPLATGLKGKTKEHTIYTTMLAESKKPDGQIVQVKPGTYRLRTQDEMPKAEAPESPAPAVESEVTPDPKPTRRKRSSRKVPAAA